MKITIGPLGLREALVGRNKGVRKAIDAAVRRSAHYGAAFLARKTPVDRGELKNAWRVSPPGVTPVTITNSAPYAGIVERGARPHAVSREGIEAITGWARRKLGLPEDEARGVAFAIAQKLKERGQEPTYFVRGSLETMSQHLRRELTSALAEYARKR